MDECLVFFFFFFFFENAREGQIETAPKRNKLFAHGRRFSPGTPASSTTKTGRHNIAEILLNLALNTNNQSINQNKAYFLK